MSLTRNQLEKISKKEVIDECLKWSGIAEKLTKIEEKIEQLTAINKDLESQVAISKNVTDLLHQRIIKLEKSQLSASQYLRRDSLEINKIPLNISDAELEGKICSALSLTGTPVTPEMLIALHRLKAKDRLIVKFKDRKTRNEVMASRRKLDLMSEELVSLGLPEKIYLNDSLCVELSELFWKCRKLKSKSVINSTWIYNNSINVKVTESGDILKVLHKSDLEKVLGIDNIDTLM